MARTQHTKQAVYKIDDLLKTAIQPFYDLGPDLRKAINKSIGTMPLTIPVAISNTEPPVLLNGSQRLKILKHQGRTTIMGTEVVIEKRATTKATCEEWALKLNLQRPVDMETKKKMALHYRTKYKWSGAKIADMFGVSPAAVSQWLQGAEKPDAVLGTDGIVRSTAKLQGNPGRPPMEPWDNKLTATMPKAILRMISLLSDPDNIPNYTELTGDQFLDAIDLLEELKSRTQRMIEAAEATAPKPKTPTKAPSKQLAQTAAASALQRRRDIIDKSMAAVDSGRE